jgi:6,7-dimethyl-8-ribityllumazine synthase
MLTPTGSKRLPAKGARFAIVASQYNARYVDSMLRAASAELKRGGAALVKVIRVPGAYEIPLVAARLARLSSAVNHSADDLPRYENSRYDAIICLGVILRGETVHAEHIGEAVSRALMEIQLRHEVPVVHEVLLLENQQQAQKRCLDPKHNRGAEAAQTAMVMAAVMKAQVPPA